MESRARVAICRKAGLVGGAVTAKLLRRRAARRHARVYELDAQGWSGAAIGREVGLSRERVRQLLERKEAV